MRVFNNASVWDAETQKWIESFKIDGIEVEEEIYFKEIEAEEYIIADECGCECENCCCEEEDFSDEEIAIISLVEDFADTVEGSDCDCGCALRNALMEVFTVGRNIGNREAEDSMREFLG